MKREVCSPSTVWFPQQCGNAQIFPGLVFPFPCLQGAGEQNIKIWIIPISASAGKLNAKPLSENPWSKTLFKNMNHCDAPEENTDCHHHTDDTKTTEAKGKKKGTLLFSLFSTCRWWHSKESKHGLTASLGEVLLKRKNKNFNLLLNFCICFAESALQCHYWTMECGNEGVH